MTWGGGGGGPGRGSPAPAAPPTPRRPRAAPVAPQQDMAWYQLFFQFPDVAEAPIAADDWAWLRTFSRGDGDLDQAIADLSRPGALTASLNWYRANVAPRMPGPPPPPPPVLAPTLGIWSARDHYLDGERMKNSASLVQGRRILHPLTVEV